jgi:hypothetical protein
MDAFDAWSGNTNSPSSILPRVPWATRRRRRMWPRMLLCAFLKRLAAFGSPASSRLGYTPSREISAAMNFGVAQLGGKPAPLR